MPQNISVKEAAEKLALMLESARRVLKLEDKSITELTKQDTEEIWILRMLLWEVAHHVSSKSRRLPAQLKADKERDIGLRQNTITV